MSFTPPIPTTRGPDLDKREVSQAIDQLGKGRSNAVGQFDLALNQISTVVPDDNVASDSVVHLSSLNAAAAAELPSTFVSAYAEGSFTVTHLSNANLRTFKYSIQG